MNLPAKQEQKMNYSESQIANFEASNAGIPQSLAVDALVERFFEGWDGSDIAALAPDYDPTDSEDWKDLVDSPAWDYADTQAIIAGIKQKIAQLRAE